MKSAFAAPHVDVITSSPARGTWIEIVKGGAIMGEAMSSPARGTWIEILLTL